MKNKIDTVDLMILRELRKDCKRPMRELAQKLRMHPNTLLQRIKRLEKSKVVRLYHADIDYQALGYDMHVIVMVKIKKSGTEEEDKVLKSLGELPEIVALYEVTGGVDCIVIVKARNREDFVRILRSVQSQKAVLRTNSFLVLAVFKEPHHFNPLENAIPQKD